MQPILLIILLALLQYWVFTLLVTRFRGKIKAPAMTGSAEFERALRVQLNTAEHLILFIPALWLFGAIVDVQWAIVLGAGFLIGRTAYAIGYLKAPPKRRLGSLLTFLVELVLLLGALGGLLLHWDILS